MNTSNRINMKKYIAGFLFSFIIYHLAPALPAGGFGIPSAMAQTCTTQYGGTTTCAPTDLTVNKQVKNPVTNFFVENLSTTDPAFSPGNEVLFKLTIKNASGETFNPVTVKDTFPSYLTFVAGPGTYDKPSNTLTFQLKNVIAGETRAIELLAKVSDKSAFPAGKSFFCVTNLANVSALNRKDSDTAQLCIQTQIMGATTLPVAGFDDLLLLLPFAGVGLGGLALLRKK